MLFTFGASLGMWRGGVLVRRQSGATSVVGSAVMGRMFVGRVEMLRSRDFQWWQDRTGALVGRTGLVVVGTGWSCGSAEGRGAWTLLKVPLARRKTLDTCDWRLDLEGG